ncbi:MAG: T9SS type B sorting domain-containing protein, partial [Bacteroidia bacterium]
TYTWTPAATLTGANTANPTASPTTTTVYSVTGTNNSGCTNTTPATVTVTVNPLPTYSLTGNVYTICNGGSQTFTVSGASTYTWTPAATLDNPNIANPTASPTSTTVYSVTGTDANTCSNMTPATVTVNVSPAPTLSLSASSYTICNGSSQALSVTAGLNTYTWTPAGSLNNSTIFNPVANPTVTTIYTVSATASGCAASTPITCTVIVNAAPPIPVLTGTASSPLIECQGVTPATLSVTTTVSVIPVWYVGTTTVATGQSYTPSTATPTTTTYIISDSSTVTGCTNLTAGNTLTVSVTVNAAPPTPVLTGTASSPLIECQGVTPATLSVTTTASVIPVWYVGTTTVATGQSYTPSTATPTTTTYIISDSSTVTGCTNLTAGNTLTVSVTVNAAPLTPILTGTVSSPLIECQGVTPATLSVTTTASVIPVWYVGTTTVATGQSYTPSTATPTTTTYIISDSSTVTGCTNLTAGNTLTVSVTVNQAPTISISSVSNNTICSGDSSVITPSGASSYTLNPGNQTGTSFTVSPTANTTYTINGSNSATGCANVSTGAGANITVLAVTASFSTTPSSATGSIPLSILFTNNSTGATNYTWTFGDGNTSFSVSPSNTYTNIGTYTVILTAMNGTCIAKDSITITADVATSFTVPNVFSPNGDGVNDEFFIINTGMSSLNCDIFNRWGQLLFTITAPGQSWDGKAPNGDNAPDGTYLFMLQMQSLDGKTYKQQGTVTLIR